MEIKHLTKCIKQDVSVMNPRIEDPFRFVLERHTSAIASYSLFKQMAHN